MASWDDDADDDDDDDDDNDDVDDDDDEADGTLGGHGVFGSAHSGVSLLAHTSPTSVATTSRPLHRELLPVQQTESYSRS